MNDTHKSLHKSHLSRISSHPCEIREFSVYKKKVLYICFRMYGAGAVKKVSLVFSCGAATRRNLLPKSIKLTDYICKFQPMFCLLRKTQTQNKKNIRAVIQHDSFLPLPGISTSWSNPQVCFVASPTNAMHIVYFSLCVWDIFHTTHWSHYLAADMASAWSTAAAFYERRIRDPGHIVLASQGTIKPHASKMTTKRRFFLSTTKNNNETKRPQG